MFVNKINITAQADRTLMRTSPSPCRCTQDMTLKSIFIYLAKVLLTVLLTGAVTFVLFQFFIDLTKEIGKPFSEYLQLFSFVLLMGIIFSLPFIFASVILAVTVLDRSTISEQKKKLILFFCCVTILTGEYFANLISISIENYLLTNL
jgi:hypothetical protein